MRRVAKGALGTWSEVAFENGDHVMVSIARDSIRIWKISRWGALFGRKELAGVDMQALAALLQAASSPHSDQPAGTPHWTTEAAAARVFGVAPPADILDRLSVEVCAREGAQDVRGLDIPNTILTVARRAGMFEPRTT
jgi:hypothetical protein